jgi:hypothetical protein
MNKAKKLEKLLGTEISFSILPQLILSFEEFSRLDSNNLRIKLENHFISKTFAIRSSAIDEDQNISNAGKYLSLLNVKIDDTYEAVTKVFESYDEKLADSIIFIQPYLSNTEASGVLFTKDPHTGSNYNVINFHQGSDTSNITAGKSNGKTFVIHESNKEFLLSANWVKKLLQLSSFCKDYFKDDSLDIEFAVLEDEPIILQVRHLYMGDVDSLSIDQQISNLNQIVGKIEDLQQKNPFLLGDSTVLGIMPDWNPAELIGIRPNILALSLFKELITDNIWAYERSNLGYRNVRSFPLLVELSGHPFIDFRTSVNSLIPADLKLSTAEKIANLYINELANNPSFHDKVEFEVILSCYTFDFDERVRKYSSELTSKEVTELKNSLLKLTRNIIRENPYGLKQILGKNKPLIERFEKLKQADLSELNKIYWLIEDCKRYGTLPFAGAARAAFIATSILNSILNKGIISTTEIDRFYGSLKSPASSILIDMNSMEKELFLLKYGHLRPGTFDITSPNYENAYELYFSQASNRDKSLNETDEICNLLSKKIDDSTILTELDIRGAELIEFASKAIIGRENVKFDFSRNISEILEQIAKIGRSYGYSRQQLSNVNINLFINAYKESSSLSQDLMNQIMSGEYDLTNSESVWLPPIICSPNEVYLFELPVHIPNFVTNNSVSAPICFLNSPEDFRDNSIMVIERADPGYDWIFTRNIKGIITCYGGANSHMAVRAKELNLPAAIGVGEEMFEKYSNCSTLFLDCRNRIIEVIQ